MLLCISCIQNDIACGVDKHNACIVEQGNGP